MASKTSTEDPSSVDMAQETCRIIVLGSHKARVRKVMALLDEPDLQAIVAAECSSFNGARIEIEYLPCVATFDSYQDESGKSIRYLMSVDYHADLHPPSGDGASSSADDSKERPASLLEFFDQEGESGRGSKEPLFRGISGVAVGSGIEEGDDFNHISKFFGTMTQSSPAEIQGFPIECIQPNDDYSTMHEELTAYKKMNDEQKGEVTKQRTLGPGKMAKFVADFAKIIIHSAIQKRLEEEKDHEKAAIPATSVGSTPSSPPQLEEQYVDPAKNRFSCRKCRRILFGQDDLQDPPHVPSKHKFGYHKHGVAASGGNSPCQSYFLQGSLVWMGDATEGRLCCPKCDTKVGSLHWSGAQCSCGTWVVPAIQIPKSKVDLVPPPQSTTFPEGTLLASPLEQRVQNLQL